MLDEYWKQKDDILELRPHHVAEIVDYKIHPEYFDIPNEKYINIWAESYPHNIRPDVFVLAYRNLMKYLIDNPDSKIKIVEGSDQICKKCPADKLCNSLDWLRKSEAYNADIQWIKEAKGIRLRKEPYTVREIIELTENKIE